ncbi:MAG: hypothetical protein A2538_00735 [Candidatus Magasanikbacteria bacterium RIFOXYD2_FULL_41_14]|uniref:Glycosyltransferase RgtA/B/C/D-like domain-containing protein n=1 Tax=Candidatus Magasanikbacteria bacterium RIFOXYD2_FULL_41_14 TaxID=1798709 RepID=A0A1F6PDT7_9BACT|nr:MAG: hypothetical protein A2538_00735 [Candidatus Magasanikbacteria bacterium RIFOXYD2_FULL_41_14]
MKNLIEIKKNMMAWLKQHYQFLLIFILADILRAQVLITRGDFWFDEMYSQHFSALPWGELWKYAVIETNPPLYTIFLHFWQMLVGSEELMLRLPSLVFSLLTIVLVYQLGQLLFNKRAGLVASLLIALSGLNVFYATENRIYSLFTLLATTSFYLFYQIFYNQKTAKKKYITFGIIQALLVFSHLTALSIPLLQFLFIYFSDKRPAIKLWLKSQIPAFIIYLPWIIPSALNKLFHAGSASGWFFNMHIPVNPLTVLTGLLLYWPNDDWGMYYVTANTIALFLMLGISIYLYHTLKNETLPKQKTIIFYLLGWIAIPIIVFAPLNLGALRMFAYVLPAFALILGYLFSKIKDWRMSASTIIIMIAILLPSLTPMLTARFIDWQKIFQPINKTHPDEKTIMVMPFFSSLQMNHYYKGDIPIIGIYPHEDGYSDDERVARYNWQKINTTDEELDQWIKKNTANKKIIFYTTLFPESMPLDWFKNNGWTIFNTYKLPPSTNKFQLYELHAPADNSTNTVKIR